MFVYGFNSLLWDTCGEIPSCTCGNIAKELTIRPSGSMEDPLRVFRVRCSCGDCFVVRFCWVVCCRYSRCFRSCIERKPDHFCYMVLDVNVAFSRPPFSTPLNWRIVFEPTTKHPPHEGCLFAGSNSCAGCVCRDNKQFVNGNPT